MTVLENKIIEHGGGKKWNLCKKIWREEYSEGHSRRNLISGVLSSDESPQDTLPHRDRHVHHIHDVGDRFLLKAFTMTLLHRRRLRFEPNKKLCFPYEPGKQATSAVKIKNICRSSIAFKFQTTAPRSCFMRPPCGVLLPGESTVATVVKLIHRPQRRARANQAKDKFKIISLKMEQGIEFTPELFDEHKDKVVVEQILGIQFLDPDQPSSELQKLKSLIAEAEAVNDASRKPEERDHERFIGPGNILEEWNKMKLARHNGKEDAK
ncbi:hypothetical protein KP509_02G025900 [Ceratopteris richardii]|uniref:MSP domain-containing protein n=1 Tax=Ceratopteris richardii TaxID=49495 RepID=A0A8T2V806_CERRI|nr:hypothetical protein KP509_02G025900 [Ceratopteris richardii]KAH7443209.1 hypothetical protein KP509_02G025900 [Ceratopteris richardii]